MIHPYNELYIENPNRVEFYIYNPNGSRGCTSNQTKFNHPFLVQFLKNQKSDDDNNEGLCYLYIKMVYNGLHKMILREKIG